MSYIPSILWALVILYLSTGPGVNLPDNWGDFLKPDKVAHMAVYGILTTLLLWGNHKQKGTKRLFRKEWIVAVLVSSIYGIGMEILQYAFFPGRYFENLDIIANIIGSFLGVLIFKRFIDSKIK